MTCGEEIATDAEVPEKWARLMNHVAANMEVHADWVGSDPAGARERDALRAVAREYRAMADAGERAAAAMRAMRPLPAVPHDPARLDRAAQARWMRDKVEMQLELAQLLTQHAEASLAVLAEMDGE
jgi:hypothetical protein